MDSMEQQHPVIALHLTNGQVAPLSTVPHCRFEVFARQLAEGLAQGKRLSALFTDASDDRSNTLYAVMLDPAEHDLAIFAATVGGSYPALTPEIPACHWFEREIFEENAMIPEGHPWLKPIRFSHGGLPGVTDYFTLAGEPAHEVAVGPVHAGVIEPGHFRFQCVGEKVHSLEIELGYQHRGVEAMFEGGPDTRSSHLAETAAGDSSLAGALAYDAILQALRADGKRGLSQRASILRTLALELERIANHTGDLGALSGDVAFLPTASFCGRIRGEFLNMTAMLCGNRFGRNYVVPGGVAFDLTGDAVTGLQKWFNNTMRDLRQALDMFFDSPSVLDRLENTGTVSEADAVAIGMVGVAGRASRVRCDSRVDLPLPGSYYPEELVIPQTASAGDVLARAAIRYEEIRYSARIVERLLNELVSAAGPAVPETDGNAALLSDSIAVSVVEAWRGELCYVALTGADGHFRKMKIVDPSFHNWFGLALALRNNEISDFPICNKSFNLSYCGHDL